MSLVLHDGVGRKVEDPPQCVSDAGSRCLVTGGFVPNGDDVLLETGSGEAIAECEQCINGVCVCVFWLYLKAYWHHGPTDLLPYHELLPQHGQDQVFPAPWCQAFPQADDPLSAHLIGIILTTTRAWVSKTVLSFENNKQISFLKPTTDLPHGFNALLEEVEVTMACQVTWTDHVTIETPELLHLSRDKSQHELELKDAGCVCLRSNLWKWTYRGKAANLFNILFVALGAGWSPWGASGVPEGVVVLKRVLTCPWNHHLQSTRQRFSHQFKGKLSTAHLNAHGCFSSIRF